MSLLYFYQVANVNDITLYGKYNHGLFTYVCIYIHMCHIKHTQVKQEVEREREGDKSINIHLSCDDVDTNISSHFFQLTNEWMYNDNDVDDNEHIRFYLCACCGGVQVMICSIYRALTAKIS